MSIVIQNLSKKYKGYNSKKFYALKDINLQIDDNTCLALIGQNGAGKTTLIKCLLGLVRHEEGFIKINDKKIGYIIQNNELGFMPEKVENLEKITGRQYINQFTILRGINSDCEENLHNLILRLSLDKYMDIPMGHCSKGNYKKILFLQAILHKPKLLILDEPTDGVDPISRRVMLDIVNDIKKSGCYVIVTTHLLSDIERIADKIAILNSGKIIEEVNRKNMREDIEDWYINCLQRCGDDSGTK